MELTEFNEIVTKKHLSRENTILSMYCNDPESFALFSLKIKKNENV